MAWRPMRLLAVLVVVIIGATRLAQADDRDSPVVILNASASGTTLTINGLNFGDRAPRVRLNGMELVVQLPSSDTQINATIPRLQPGTYLLTVIHARREGHRDDDDASRFGTFDVTVGVNDRISALEAALIVLQSTVATLQLQSATLQSRVATLQSQNTTLQSTVNALLSSDGSLRLAVSSLQTLPGLITNLQGEVHQLDANGALALGPYVRVETGSIKGLNGPHIIFSGANVHIQSGSGYTDDNTNAGGLGPSLGESCANLTGCGSPLGLGNLIIGYNETRPFTDPLHSIRSGSHNFILGPFHQFNSVGGLLAGMSNTVDGAPYASVSGGDANTASGVAATVSGGASNWASGFAASVSAGGRNTASGSFAGVSGGESNVASGGGASVSGGGNNTAFENVSTVSGGESNTASGIAATVSGGTFNKASGFAASVSAGGGPNTATGETLGNTASGNHASVSGGERNTASGDHATVSGGAGNVANGPSQLSP